MKIMMNTKMVLSLLVVVFCTGSVFAQNDTTWTLDPNTLIPDTAGYYIGGAYKDTDDDGEEEFHNECFDAYGDSEHSEYGYQQGWYYGEAMIMPTCDGKGSPSGDFDANGYIELGKSRVWTWEEDSSRITYILSEKITDLQSLTIRVGTDLSLGGRQIFVDVVSMNDTTNGKDELLGANTYRVHHEIGNQGGEVLSLEADGSNQAFNEIANLSTEGPIFVRIQSGIVQGSADEEIERPAAGDRLKIFGVEMVATKAETNGGGNDTITAVGNVHEQKDDFFEVNNMQVTAKEGTVHVYDYTGGFVGSGQSVRIPQSGLYIIRDEKGNAAKTLIN